MRFPFPKMHMRRNSSQLEFNIRRQAATASTRNRRLACLGGAFLVWLLLSYALTPGFSARGTVAPKLPAGCLGSTGGDEGRFHRSKGVYATTDARYRLQGEKLPPNATVDPATQAARQCRHLHVRIRQCDRFCPGEGAFLNLKVLFLTPCARFLPWLQGHPTRPMCICSLDSLRSRQRRRSSSHSSSPTTGCTVRVQHGANEELIQRQGRRCEPERSQRPSRFASTSWRSGGPLSCFQSAADALPKISP